MSYSTKFGTYKTMTIVLLAVLVSFSFMGCQPVVTPIEAPADMPSIVTTSFTMVGTPLASLDYTESVYSVSLYNNDQSTCSTMAISSVIGDWQIATTNPANSVYHDDGPKAPLYLPLIDSTGTYRSYLKISHNLDTITFTETSSAPSAFYSTCPITF